MLKRGKNDWDWSSTSHNRSATNKNLVWFSLFETITCRGHNFFIILCTTVQLATCTLYYLFLSESKIADYIGHWYAGRVNFGQAQCQLTNFFGIFFSGQRKPALFGGILRRKIEKPTILSRSIVCVFQNTMTLKVCTSYVCGSKSFCTHILLSAATKTLQAGGLPSLTEVEIGFSLSPLTAFSLPTQMPSPPGWSHHRKHTQCFI